MWWTYPAIAECRKLYYDEKKSIEEIARYFNVDEDSVQKVLAGW